MAPAASTSTISWREPSGWYVSMSMVKMQTEGAALGVMFATEPEMRQHVERLGKAGNFHQNWLYPAKADGEWEEDPFETVTPDDFKDEAT